MTFINGIHFKHQCSLQLTDYADARTPLFSIKHDHQMQNDLVFCIPEYLAMLREQIDNGVVKVPDNFTLITHNSDVNFSEQAIESVVEYFPEMINWYTTNLLAPHPKVLPIPIGIANPKWSHGNQDRFKKVMEENNKKDKTYYANFNISTNPEERNYCCKALGIEIEEKYPDAASIKDHDDFVEKTHEGYLRNMAQSYFTLSPDGNGKDCHKTWEAIYMRSIPIVTNSYFATTFQNLGIPIFTIDDWRDFNHLNLTEKLYDETWGDFDPSSLDFSLFTEDEDE
tara:strand:+ start:331 stop:1179 length:849 start_codon:yes stop_codon:yes gene_type:complete